MFHNSSPSRRGTLPELFLTLLVIAGLVNCANRFIVDGKLPQPFIFDINDTFMDWFNTAYWAHNPGAFDVWRTVYPPLSFVFLKITGSSGCYVSDSITARNCDQLSIYTILTCYTLGAFSAYLAFRKNDRRSAVVRGLSFGLGLPLLFTLERGNLILPCFIFFALSHGNVLRNPISRAFAFAATINFKPYLLLPIVALAFKRRWRSVELTGIATIILYLITFSMLGDGSPIQLFNNTLNFVTFARGLVWEQIYYSTSFVPFLQFDNYRFPTRDYIPTKIFEALIAAIPIAIQSTRALALAALTGAWFQPRVLSTSRISTLVLGMSLVGQSPGGYTEVFLIFLLFLEPWCRAGQVIALIAGYLLCVPYDYVMGTLLTLSGDSWLSGRTVAAPFGIAIGTFARPALILVIVWSLALDSLGLLAADVRLTVKRRRAITAST